MNFKQSAINQKKQDSERPLKHVPPQQPRALTPLIVVPLWMKVVVIVFALTVLGGAVTLYSIAMQAYSFVQHVQEDPLSAVLEIAGAELTTDENNRTNILLLGSGGKEYDAGSDLTDSVILASIDHTKEHVTLISIPRDLVVYLPEYREYHRINTLFTLSRKRLGENRKDELVRQAVEAALCQPVHYYAKVDFSGFTQLIDTIGGVDVDVERQFTDYQYPTANYGYQTIHFEKGVQRMDGATALMYARSRHGTNGEASDFARAARQQRLLQAVWQKAHSLNLLSNPEMIESIVNTVNDHYETDMRIKEMLTLASMGKQMLMPEALPASLEAELAASPDDTTAGELPVTVPAPAGSAVGEKITTIVLTDGPEGLLYTPTDEVRNQYYGGAFVLLPDGDNFDTICAYIKRVLRDPLETSDGPTIEVLNGSGTGFLARDVGAFLVKEGYTVSRRDNTFQQRTYTGSYIYDHSRGGNLDALIDLQKLLNIEGAPDNTEPVFFNDIDITIVLGSDFVMPEGALGEPLLQSEQRSDGTSATTDTEAEIQ